MSTKQPVAAKRSRSPRSTHDTIDPEHSHGTELEARQRRIAIAAFYRAEARGFAPGGELEDWLQAEREIDSLDAGASRTQGRKSPSTAARPKRSADPAAPPRKRAATKRSRTPRGTDTGARNREDES